MLTPSLGLLYNITEHLALGGQLGYIRSLDGAFSATSSQLSLQWQPTLYQADNANSSITAGSYQSWQWQPELLQRQYWLPNNSVKADGSTPMAASVHLFGVGMTQPLTHGLQISGRTFWAGWGNVGAYAEGWFGLGFEQPIGQHLFNIYSAVGVSGGGGMDVGSGLLSEITTGYGYNFGQLKLEFDIGYTQAILDDFKAMTTQLRLAWPIEFAWH